MFDRATGCYPGFYKTESGSAHKTQSYIQSNFTIHSLGNLSGQARKNQHIVKAYRQLFFKADLCAITVLSLAGPLPTKKSFSHQMTRLCRLPIRRGTYFFATIPSAISPAIPAKN